jgi:hypothetical protein
VATCVFFTKDNSTESLFHADCRLAQLKSLNHYSREVSDTVHLFSMDERKTNSMQLLYIFIVAVGDALHVSGVFAHRQER